MTKQDSKSPDEGFERPAESVSATNSATGEPGVVVAGTQPAEFDPRPPIPGGVPTVTFYANDKLAALALAFYIEKLADSGYRRALIQRHTEFKKFAIANPDHMTDASGLLPGPEAIDAPPRPRPTWAGREIPPEVPKNEK